MILYDCKGRAVAYSDDGETIYLFSGKPVAYFYAKYVYKFDGRQIGFWDAGWVLDNNGRYVLFSEQAKGGPIKPIKQPFPIKRIKEIRPIKSVRHVPMIGFVKKKGWAPISGENFFVLG